MKKLVEFADLYARPTPPLKSAIAGRVASETVILSLLKGLPLERTPGKENSVDIAGEIA